MCSKIMRENRVIFEPGDLGEIYARTGEDFDTT